MYRLPRITHGYLRGWMSDSNQLKIQELTGFVNKLGWGRQREMVFPQGTFGKHIRLGQSRYFFTSTFAAPGSMLPAIVRL